MDLPFWDKRLPDSAYLRDKIKIFDDASRQSLSKNFNPLHYHFPHHFHHYHSRYNHCNKHVSVDVYHKIFHLLIFSSLFTLLLPIYTSLPLDLGRVFIFEDGLICHPILSGKR
jgi:hypothetical protein